MDRQPIPHGTKVRLRAGAEVRSTREDSRGTNSRARTIKVHSSSEAGRVCIGGLDLDGTEVHTLRYVLSMFNIFSKEAAQISEALDLLECVISREDLNDVLKTNSRLSLDPVGRIMFEITPAWVSWVGTGGYWCWSDLCNFELVHSVVTEGL